MTIWTTNAVDPPITTMIGRARVAMITVARNVLSGNSRTNIRAMMPRNVPTFMRASKLLPHRRGEGEAHTHTFDVLLDLLLFASEGVRLVECLDVVGESHVVDERGDAARRIGQRVGWELREYVGPARRHVPPHTRTGNVVGRENREHRRPVLIAELAEALFGRVECDALVVETAESSHVPLLVLRGAGASEALE